jgi:hypothetical protein
LTAQVCDTIIDGEPMNCIDVNGMKQGTWVTFDNKLRYCFDEEGTNSISSVGEYEDDEKIGSWRYFNGPKYNSGITKEIIYHKSDSIEENIFGFFGISEKTIFKDNLPIFKKVDSYDYNYIMKFQNDKRLVIGEFILGDPREKDSEKIIISCENDSCMFILEDNQTLLSFASQDLNKLEFELARLSMGVYSRKIKSIKASIK